VTEADLLQPLLAGIGAAGAFGLMAHQLRRARLIEDIPASKIRSAPQGHVELSGFAKTPAEGHLLSPLTKTPCVWYHYRIERADGIQRERWRTTERGTSTQPFLVDDGTGHCLVDPRGADITTVRHRRWKEGRHRYTESCLRADDWLYLVGWFESLHPPGAEEQAKLLSRQLLREWKSDQPSLLARFDTNGDNTIDGTEWEQARTSAAAEAQRRTVQQYDPTPLHRLKRPPLRRYPYLIANRDPKLLAGRYRWRARFSLAGAILMMIWCGTAFLSMGISAP
jgi:hypothetical protein